MGKIKFPESSSEDEKIESVQKLKSGRKSSPLGTQHFLEDFHSDHSLHNHPASSQQTITSQSSNDSQRIRFTESDSELAASLGLSLDEDISSTSEEDNWKKMAEEESEKDELNTGFNKGYSGVLEEKEGENNMIEEREKDILNTTFNRGCNRVFENKEGNNSMTEENNSNTNSEISWLKERKFENCLKSKVGKEEKGLCSFDMESSSFDVDSNLYSEPPLPQNSVDKIEFCKKRKEPLGFKKYLEQRFSEKESEEERLFRNKGSKLNQKLTKELEKNKKRWWRKVVSDEFESDEREMFFEKEKGIRRKFKEEEYSKIMNGSFKIKSELRKRNIQVIIESEENEEEERMSSKKKVKYINLRFRVDEGEDIDKVKYRINIENSIEYFKEQVES